MNWIIIRKIDTWIGIPFLFLLRAMRIFARPAELPEARTIRKILFVKFWGIGNIFMMLPSAALLKTAYPGAQLHLLTLHTNREAAEATHEFAAVHVIDTRSMLRFISTVAGKVTRLRREAYDIIIDFEQFAKFSAIVSSLLRARYAIGFDTAGQHRHHLYSRAVPYDNSVHITASYRTMVRIAAAEKDAAAPFALQACDARRGGELTARLGIRLNTMLVVLHVGTSDNFSERRWPAAHFSALADLLIAHHDVQIVLAGLADEADIAADVKGRINARHRVIDASGQLNFTEYLMLIQMSDLVISADTAAVHVASAAATPVVGLYGPNTPVLYGPWGADGVAFYEKLECSPCITNFNAKIHVCRHPDGKGACMQKLSAAEVYRGIRDRYFASDSAHTLKKRSQPETCIQS